MYITYNKIMPIKSNELSGGDLFRFADDDLVYMALDDGKYIDVSEGRVMGDLNGNEKVTRVNGRLVLEATNG